MPTRHLTRFNTSTLLSKNVFLRAVSVVLGVRAEVVDGVVVRVTDDLLLELAAVSVLLQVRRQLEAVQIVALVLAVPEDGIQVEVHQLSVVARGRPPGHNAFCAISPVSVVFALFFRIAINTAGLFYAVSTTEP